MSNAPATAALPALATEVTIATMTTRFGSSTPTRVTITGMVAEHDEKDGMFRMNFVVNGMTTFTWAYADEIVTA